MEKGGDVSASRHEAVRDGGDAKERLRELNGTSDGSISSSTSDVEESLEGKRRLVVEDDTGSMTTRVDLDAASALVSTGQDSPRTVDGNIDETLSTSDAIDQRHSPENSIVEVSDAVIVLQPSPWIGQL